jgi:hypothetical protein
MTQDEIIALAKQVGFPIQHPEWQKAVGEFAALVEAKSAANEREACAKLVEAESHMFATLGAAKSLAEGIRDRGDA